jgi:hypothetical protein
MTGMMKKYGLPLLLLVICACEKDVQLKLPEVPAKLAIHATWEKDSIITATITRSYNISETPRFGTNEYPTPETYLKKYAVSNARVKVFRNGAFLEELVYNQAKYIYISPSGTRARGDASYRVSVEADGLTTAHGPDMSFSDAVPITMVQVRRDVARDESGNKLSEVILEFDDPAGTKNFYWLEFKNRHRTIPDFYFGTPNIVYPVDKDVVLPVGDVLSGASGINWDQIIMKDDNFNGQRKRVLIRISSFNLFPPGSTSEIQQWIYLRNVSEDVFKYIRSRVIDTNNPFASPAQPHTNITGGLGIFGLHTSDARQLQ